MVRIDKSTFFSYDLSKTMYKNHVLAYHSLVIIEVKQCTTNHVLAYFSLQLTYMY